MLAVHTVAVTGHRDLGPAGADTVRRVIREIAPTLPRATWLCGGAVGADQLAAHELILHGARLELVLAFPLDVQGARWSPSDRWRLEAQAAYAECVEVVQVRYRSDGYHRRNRRLVQRADMVLAFWRVGQQGGTASTIREAHRRNVPVVVCPIA